MNSQSNQLFWVTTAASCLLGVFAFGFIGFVMTFWIMLFWYSIWKPPRRFEMLFLSIVGFSGALVFLPTDFWPNVNKIFVAAFGIVAMIPCLDLFLRDGTQT